MTNIRTMPEPDYAILSKCKWKSNPVDLLIDADVTEDSAVWQTYSIFGGPKDAVHLTYRTDFSRKDLEYVFEDIPVMPKEQP